VNRILIFGAAAVASAGIAATPAIAGLAGNSSFSHQIPVRVPSQARTPDLFDDHGASRDGGHRSTPSSRAAEPGDDRGSREPDPGDDRGLSGAEPEPGDDDGGARTTAEPGDDRGGDNTSAEPGDDDGGARTTAEPGDDRGGDNTSAEPGDDNGGRDGGGHGRDG
jgi:hypothetical protein